MISFDEVFDRLMGHEGKYSNNPADPGGETMWGITKRVALEFGYRGAMRKLPREKAKEIARVGYWKRAGCEQYDSAIGWQVMDAAFNHGIENAVRFLQRAVRVADDGVIGPISLAAVKQHTVTDVLMRFNAQRLRFYTKLSTFDEFGRGWTNRVAGNLDYGADDA